MVVRIISGVHRGVLGLREHAVRGSPQAVWDKIPFAPDIIQ